VAVAFRPLLRSDFGLLSTWMARPHVAEFWCEDASPGAVEAAYQPMIDGTDPTEGFVVELDGRPVGFVQRYLVDDHPAWAVTIETAAAVIPTARAVGIDYLIGEPDLVGVGLGPAVIDTFSTDTLARYPSATLLAVGVHQDNRRSWRALEKAGFTRVFAGTLASDDPSDAGPQYLYVRYRPSAHPGTDDAPR
jgi:aminoglycoside 6'-N-acetyltransferase